MKVDYDSYQAMTSDERRDYHAERDTMTESELLSEKLMDSNDRLEARIEMQETLQGQNVAMIEGLLERIERQAETICKHDDRLNAQAIVVARRGEQIEAHDQRLDHLAARIGRVESRVDHAVAATKRLHDGICTINERLAIHVTRADASASMHESAGMMRNMDHDRTDRLEARIGKLSDRVDDHSDTINEKLSDVEFQLEGKVDDLDREHGQRLTDLESELEDTTRTANSAEMEASDAKSDLYSLDQSVDGLKSELSTLSHTVNYG